MDWRKEAAEKLVHEEYGRLAGKVLRVRCVHGYIKETDDSDDFYGDFLVHVDSTDNDSLEHWNDGCLDPYYDVSVLSGPRTDIRSTWIDGTSYSLDGKVQSMTAEEVQTVACPHCGKPVAALQEIPTAKEGA